MTIALPIQPNDFAREVERITGHPVRFTGTLPVHHALQYLDHETTVAGLVWRKPTSPPTLGFARVTYSSPILHRFGLGPADLAAIALAQLGILHLADMPRAARRSVSVKPIPPARVVAAKP
ncbi:hypothetical protein [Paracoccus sp. KR1-242]|uniref:hypothetical protein n=1 Tax=Paracoccus sp. KR1-242 TaxID=3410028 RepID=UPI003C03A844